MVIHWSLSETKSPQVSRTVLRILADLNNAVVWMSSSPCDNPLVTVPREPITIDVTVTLMFPSYFNSPERFRHLSFFSLSFSFTLWSAGTAKPTIRQVLFFADCYLASSSGQEKTIRLYISKLQRSLCVSISRIDSWLCIYHLFVRSNLIFLHNFQWIILPTQCGLS